jgi:hypothetical protein
MHSTGKRAPGASDSPFASIAQERPCTIGAAEWPPLSLPGSARLKQVLALEPRAGRLLAQNHSRVLMGWESDPAMTAYDHD